jgi:hypothetical protein
MVRACVAMGRRMRRPAAMRLPGWALGRRMRRRTAMRLPGWALGRRMRRRTAISTIPDHGPQDPTADVRREDRDGGAGPVTGLTAADARSMRLRNNRVRAVSAGEQLGSTVSCHPPGR